MIRPPLCLSLLVLLILYDGVQSKRGGGTSGGRGSSASRSSSSYSSRGSSSSRGRSSSGGRWFSGWFGGGSRHYSSSTYRGGSYSSGGVSYGSSSSYPYEDKPKFTEHPTVTKIKDVLFPGDCRKPSEEIFIVEEYAHLRSRYTKNGEERELKDHLNRLSRWLEAMKGGDFNIDFNDEESLRKARKRMQIMNEEDEEEVIVKDESRPIIVGSISYFWGDQNLPQFNETDCIDFSPINDSSSITLCNATSMTSCKKSNADVVLLGKGKKRNGGDVKVVVKNANGTIIDEFAWFCPPSEKCCDWDCCATEK